MAERRLKPQLLREVHESDLDKLLQSDDYAMSQKIDGMRLMLERSDLNVNGIGRSGNVVQVPAVLKSEFVKVRSNWTFDGELVGNKYYVFDIIKFPGGNVNHLPWVERQKLINAVLQDFSDIVKIVPQHYGDSKLKFFNEFRTMRSEGVVFSNVNDRYRFGIRSPLSLKYKFVKTIDCVVIDKGINDKDNLVLGVYDNGELVDVGKVSSITGDGKNKTFNIGDVVTVTYLYGTDSRRLYQPVKPILRTDKGAEECLMDQMILKNSQILL